MMKKALSLFCAAVICATLSLMSFADTSSSKLVDNADLLNTAEENSILSELNKVSEEYNVDIVIVTVTGLDGMSADAYIEDYYDSNNYGQGENRDGVMLLVSMGEREYRILSNGFGATAITTDEIEYIGDTVAPYLTDENYFGAFNAFIEECEYEINGEINGFPFDLGFNLIVALVIGLITALIVTGVMKSKLKSVRKQPGAKEYAKKGSMKVTRANDLFLYRTVGRRKKESNSSSGSRGSSRNVGGGKF